MTGLSEAGNVRGRAAKSHDCPFVIGKVIVSKNFFAKVQIKISFRMLNSEICLTFAAVKRVMYILGILTALLLFSPEESLTGSSDVAAVNTEKAVVEKDARSDMQTQIAVLSKEMKSNNLLTPRRTLPSFTQSTTIRQYDGVQRILQYFRLKGGNTLVKVLEHETDTQTIYFSTLCCNKAHHVFALRKLLI